jgi:hypothetical protein
MQSQLVGIVPIHAYIQCHIRQDHCLPEPCFVGPMRPVQLHVVASSKSNVCFRSGGSGVKSVVKGTCVFDHSKQLILHSIIKAVSTSRLYIISSIIVLHT